MIITISASKGGVGKTTVTACLASALSKAGKKVLVIDLDPQGDLSSILGCNKDASQPSLDQILDASKRDQPALLKRAILPIKDWADVITPGLNLEATESEIGRGISPERRLQDALGHDLDYDFILLDTPKGDGLLTTNALIATDAVLVILQTEPLALKNLNQMLEKIEQIRDRANPGLHITGIVPSKFKKLELADAILNQLQGWAKSDSKAYSRSGTNPVWIAPAVPEYNLYTELSVMGQPLHKMAGRRARHTSPFTQLAVYLGEESHA